MKCEKGFNQDSQELQL